MMQHDDFERIANEVLDGTAAPADREAFERRLAEDAGARAKFEALRSVVTKLDRVGLEEAPRDLLPSVLRATVAQRRTQKSVSRSEWWAEIVGGFLRAASARGALTFASGVGVGAVIVAVVAGPIVGGRHTETTGLSGTMAPPATPAERPIESTTLRGEGVTVTADTRRTTDGVILRLEASGEGASGAQLTAAFSRGEFLPATLRMEPPSAGDVEVGSEGVTIVLSGAGTFTLALRSESARTAPLDLELRARGRFVRAKLATNSGESR